MISLQDPLVSVALTTFSKIKTSQFYQVTITFTYGTRLLFILLRLPLASPVSLLSPCHQCHIASLLSLLSPCHQCHIASLLSQLSPHHQCHIASLLSLRPASLGPIVDSRTLAISTLVTSITDTCWLCPL